MPPLRMVPSTTSAHMRALATALVLLTLAPLGIRRAQADPLSDAVGRLRGLMATGRLQEVATLADSLLGAEVLSQRADSLRSSDIRALWIESRLRLGLATTEPTPSRIQELVTLRERLFGPENPELATSLDYLGILKREQGDPASARNAFRRGLDIRNFVIPGRQDHEMPKVFREELMKSLRDGYPQQYEERIRGLARGILAQALERDRFDWVEDVASEIPMWVFSEIMGLPLEDRRRNGRALQLIDGVERRVESRGVDAVVGFGRFPIASREHTITHEDSPITTSFASP